LRCGGSAFRMAVVARLAAMAVVVAAGASRVAAGCDPGNGCAAASAAITRRHATGMSE